MFKAQWRNVFSDVNVTEWLDVLQLQPATTPLQVYNDLCKYAGKVLDVVGFVDQREWGHIRTGTSYGDFTLFQYPDERDRSSEIFVEFQYRIIGSAEVQIPVEGERLLCLE
jgi:hypothetical protein